jgi:hypothetical protein
MPNLIAIANFIGLNEQGFTPPFGGQDIVTELSGVQIVTELNSRDIITEKIP